MLDCCFLRLSASKLRKKCKYSNQHHSYFGLTLSKSKANLFQKLFFLIKFTLLIVNTLLKNTLKRTTQALSKVELYLLVDRLTLPFPYYTSPLSPVSVQQSWVIIYINYVMI